MKTTLPTIAVFPHEAASLSRLRIEVKNGIGFLLLKENNSDGMDADFLTEVSFAHEILECDPNVHGVIWASETGERFPGAFASESLERLDPEERLRLFRHLFNVVQTVFAFSKPELVLLHESVSAAGALLAFAADWRFISGTVPHISFEQAMPGLPLPEALRSMIASVSGEAARRAVFQAGGFVHGKHLLHLGLVNEIVPPENLLSRGEMFMRRNILNPPEYMSARKRHLRRAVLQRFDADFSLSDALLHKWESHPSRSPGGVAPL